MPGPADIAKEHPLVSAASPLPAVSLKPDKWVRDACSSCQYMGKSWSCPPGTGSLQECGRRLSGFRKALAVRFRASGNRKALESAVLEIESSLRAYGFPRAMGFFVSPCTACPGCSYPVKCAHPDKCRPTGESWGIDLISALKKAGLPVKVVEPGQDFQPVTLFLLE